MRRISIIGGGRLGATMGHALASKGFEIAAVSCRTRSSALESARLIGSAQATTVPSRAAAAAEIIFLCIPDDATADLARELAVGRGTWADKTVYQTSGLLPAKVLAPLKARGASTASFHPAQTFARKEAAPAAFRGVTFALEGDAPAVAMGYRIAGRLGGRGLTLSPKDKAVYHAACHLASAGTITLLHEAADLLGQAGLAPEKAVEVFMPLVERSLHNVKKIGPRKALTGPMVRGDIRTVRAHLEALSHDPGIRALYSRLARRALNRTLKNGISARALRTWKRLLEE